MNIEIKKIYFPNGNIRCEIPFLNSKKNGTEKTFSQDGIVTHEIDYVNNEMNGLYKHYYVDTESLERIIPYVNGKRHGIARWYNTKSDGGGMCAETTFINGIERGVEKWFNKHGLIYNFMTRNSEEVTHGIKIEID